MAGSAVVITTSTSFVVGNGQSHVFYFKVSILFFKLVTFNVIFKVEKDTELPPWIAAIEIEKNNKIINTRLGRVKPSVV